MTDRGTMFPRAPWRLSLTFLLVGIAFAFLSMNVVVADEGENEGGSSKGKKYVVTGKFPIPADHNFITTVTADNFRKVLIESTQPLIVFMYKKGDTMSRHVSKNIEGMALSLRPLIGVYSLDAESEPGKELSQTYGIGNVPVVLFFNSGLRQVGQPGSGQFAKLPVGYEGDGSVGGLVRWALQTLSTETIERVWDEHTLAHFLSVHNSYNLPKILLLTDENVTAPAFRVMAQTYRYGAVFGVSHGERAIAERYGVTEFPTVLGITLEGGEYVVQQLGPSALSGTSENAEDDSVFESLNKFVKSIAISEDLRQNIVIPLATEEEAARRRAEEQAKFASALDPMIINSRATWKTECLTRRRGVCLVVFRDKEEFLRPDGPDMTMYQELSRTAASKSSTPLQVVLVDGLTNYKLVQQFGITNGIPDALAIFPARKKYYNFVGALNARNLARFFLDKVLHNKAPRDLPKKVPKFLETTQDDAASSADSEKKDDKAGEL